MRETRDWGVPSPLSLVPCPRALLSQLNRADDAIEDVAIGRVLILRRDGNGVEQIAIAHLRRVNLDRLALTGHLRHVREHGLQSVAPADAAAVVAVRPAEIGVAL